MMYPVYAHDGSVLYTEWHPADCSCRRCTELRRQARDSRTYTHCPECGKPLVVTSSGWTACEDTTHGKLYNGGKQEAKARAEWKYRKKRDPDCVKAFDPILFE